MQAYKNVYKNENGILVRNTENKISYTDENGVKRTRTNPTYADFARAGMYPKRYKEGVPDYDPETESVEEVFEIKDGYFEITYKIKEED